METIEFELSKITSGYYTEMEHNGETIELGCYATATEAIERTRDVALKIWRVMVKETACTDD